MPECVLQIVDFSFSVQRLIQVFCRLAAARRLPRVRVVPENYVHPLVCSHTCPCLKSLSRLDR